MPGEPARRPLTRDGILRAGLRLIDQDGLAAFTMRKLARELDVDPMSIYNHVENKEALLDGLADTLWGEIELPRDDGDWEALLHSFATSLRSLAHAHPHAYPLLLSHRSWSLAMLNLSNVIVERLQGAGFEQKRAAVVLCTVMSYAMGYTLMEVTTLLPGPSDQATEAKSDFERLTQLMPRLPRETPARMVEVASVLMDLDAEAPFTFGLDLMLTGLKSGQG